MIAPTASPNECDPTRDERVETRDGQKQKQQPNSTTPATTTNNQFLRAICRGHPGKPWATSFKTDPKTATSQKWTGQQMRTTRDMPRGDANTYFCVGTFPEGATRRLKDSVAAVLAIVLDDIGADELNDLPLYSWALETSPFNYQVGYALAPGENIARVDSLLGAMTTAGHSVSDRSGNSISRYVRLPVGVNTKDTVIADVGAPFPTRLVEWWPERRFSVDELAAAFSIDMATLSDRAVGGNSSPETDDELREAIASCATFHDPLVKLAARFVGRGMSQEDVVAVLTGLMDEAALNLASAAKPDQRRGEWKARYDEIPRTVESAAEKFRDPRTRPGRTAGPRSEGGKAPAAAGDTTGRAKEGAVRPEIRWSSARLAQCVDEAEDALIAAGEQIYRRGATLVRPARGAVDTLGKVCRSDGTLSLIPVDPNHLVERLTIAAAWYKFDGRSEEWKLTGCPMEVAKTYLAREGYWRVPTLRAVVQHPVMMPSGQVISVGGYDPDTGILLDIQGKWAIPDAPSRDDAVAALGRLKHLFRYFPWATPTDWAVAASALMSALARPVLNAVPGHGVDAPEAGSGKSLLIDAISIAATGVNAPVMEWGRDLVEAGKRLDGMLLAGDAIISIDNIDAPLEGAVLCQTLSQTSRRIRPLGGSKMTTVPMTAFVTATGNNLVLRGDITRRMLICRIDAQTDAPELRVIDQDLLAECSKRRKEIVADALTVMVAYMRAGRPSVKLRPLGSYGDWSRMVRDALVWCGLKNPVDALLTSRHADPARAALSAVLNAWRAAFGRDSKTAAEAVAQAVYDTDLRDALALVAERKGVLSSSAFGYWLRSHRDGRSGDYVLRGGGQTGGVVRWSVELPQDQPNQGNDRGGITGIRGMFQQNAANCQKGQSKERGDTLDKAARTSPQSPLSPAASPAEPDDLPAEPAEDRV